MKFIDSLDRQPRQNMSRARKKVVLCPFPDGCYPVSYYIGTNGAGHCCGMMTKATNLDCVRMCVFSEKLDGEVAVKGKMEYTERFMTPTEAMSLARALVSAAENAIEFNSEYRRHFEHLCDVRKDGKGNENKI